MSTVAIVLLAFGLRGKTPADMRLQEPNPCNIRLGIETARIKEIYRNSVVVAQWESADWLERHGVPVDHTVELRPDGEYLDTKLVWIEARDYLREQGIDRVVFVAQPWMGIHLWYARRMATKDHFIVIKEKINPIDFDDDERNSQPWTKTRLAFLWFCVTRVFGRKAGHNGRQVASESPA